MPRIADRIGSATGNVDPRQKAEAQLDFNASAILELLRTLYRVPHTKRPKTCWPADVRSTGGFSYWISSVPKKGQRRVAEYVGSPATSLKFICRNPSTRNASNPVTEAGDGDHPSGKGRKNERLL
jgi:hypothetical protein